MRMPSDRTQVPEPAVPTVDQVDFRALYTKTRYVVDTADGWSLMVSRYRPRPQPWPQPLMGEPLLLVHGFSQNRHTWTSGEFVKNLLYFGADVHVLELRGHGLSSIRLQYERARRHGRPVPPDVDYGWDIDSYFLYDLPAGVAAVKRITRRDRIFYCGHSMGGMLGYGYAGIHDDFEGLITIGAPGDLGADLPLLRTLAVSGPALTAAIDLTLGAVNLEQRVTNSVGKAVADVVERFNPELAGELRPGPVPRRRSYRYLPVDSWQRLAERLLARAEVHPLYAQAYQRLGLLANSQRVATQDIRWLLREGGERESRGVVNQFAKWIRKREMVCYRTGYDFKRGFSKIRVPMAIIFGDMDPLASVESTRSVYRSARSDYLLWRPVKGNSHVELTMGHDIRQICYDIKNLMEYARTHRHRAPSLPRLR